MIACAVLSLACQRPSWEESPNAIRIHAATFDDPPTFRGKAPDLEEIICLRKRNPLRSLRVTGFLAVNQQRAPEMDEVTVEVVGIYFRKEVELPKSRKKRTVKDIMDLTISQYGSSATVGGLDYMTDGRTNPMSVIRHNFPGGVTRSGYVRMAGIYELREDRSNPPAVQAWQYYVLDEENDRVSATYPGEGFSSFVDAEFDFADKWKLIWRLVTILKEPNIPAVV